MSFGSTILFGTHRSRLILCAALTFLSACLDLVARDGDPSVSYLPATENVEGDQPLLHSYVLRIIAPVGITSPVSVVPVVGVVTAPAGVSTAQALSFVSLSASAENPVLFSAGGEAKSITVTVQVPEGASAGDYGWSISTPGWPTRVIDGFAFINAKVNISQEIAAPSVTIAAPLDGSTYTYKLGEPALEIPLQFAATTPTIAPITSIDADVSGTGVDDLVGDGLGTDAVLASGTIKVSQAGIYTVQARATNAGGTSANTVEINVNVEVPPPTVTIESPSPASALFFMPGNPLNVAFVFTGKSAQGPVTAVSASLDGIPVTFDSSGIGTQTATGTGTLMFENSGVHVLSVSATNAVGTNTTTQSINVVEIIPVAPAVTITSPATGTTFELPADGSALSIPFAFAASAVGSQTISSASAALDGNGVTVVTDGIDTANTTSNGAISLSTAGTYTLTASAASAGQTGVASISFTVRATPPHSSRPSCSLEWLPPVSLGKVQQGGSPVPIKFVLNCECTTCRHDTSVVIAIHEIFPDGSSSEPTLFPYGAGSPNPSEYALNANGMYHLNFTTSGGTHRYHIDVIRPIPGTGQLEILGTKEFMTK